MEVDWRRRYGDWATWWIIEESWFDVRYVCALAVVLSGQIEHSSCFRVSISALIM